MVQAEIDYTLSEREDDAALARWAPKALQEVARVFGRINSGLILENRLGLSLSNLRQRGKQFVGSFNASDRRGGRSSEHCAAAIRWP